jgi:hypothetical protein
MNNQGENVGNDKEKRGNKTNQRISEVSFRVVLRPRSLPDIMISESTEKQDDEEFQGFVTTGVEVSISPTESEVNFILALLE